MHLTPITRSEFLYAFEAVPVYFLSRSAREDIISSLYIDGYFWSIDDDDKAQAFIDSLDPRGCFQSSEPVSHIILDTGKVAPVYNTYIRTREECYKLSDPLPAYSI